MLTMTIRERKELDAQKILNSCIGKEGVWADPTRYRYQNWTRDFVLAVMPLLFQKSDSQSLEIARRHLKNLSALQRPNGQIPILFLDKTWPFLVEKLKRSWREGKMSFMLKRWLMGELWNLTPGTRDSEIMYVIGMHEYARFVDDQSFLRKYKRNIAMAFDRIERDLIQDDTELHIGCDWRDTMHIELGDKALLSNNALLYQAYVLAGKTRKAKYLKYSIENAFFVDGKCIDYPESDRFDPLGASLAVIYDAVFTENYPCIVEGFKSVDTPHGVTIQCIHNAYAPEEQEVFKRTNGVVVWPFVVGFSVIALTKMGEHAMAREQFRKLERLDGFREWYDPETGKGYGAIEQLWSAVLFLRALSAMKTVQ